jgi:hypothetical protein
VRDCAGRVSVQLERLVPKARCFSTTVRYFST